jgi:hypothetical protein
VLKIIRKAHEKEKHECVGGGRSRRRIILSQGFQASLAPHSDKNIMKLKALEHLEVLA